MCLNFSKFFVDIWIQASFWAIKLKLNTWRQIFFVYKRWKFQLSIFNTFGEKVRTTRSSEIKKISDFSKLSRNVIKKTIKFLWLSISPEEFMKISRSVSEKSSIKNRQEKEIWIIIFRRDLVANCKSTSSVWFISIRAHYVTQTLKVTWWD